MKSKIMYLRAFLLMLSTLPVLTFAQGKNDNNELLQGKWALESVRAFKANDTTSVKVNDLNIKIYTELEVKQNSAFLISKESTLQGTSEIDETGVHFDFSSAALTMGGNILDHKLYLQQKIDNPLSEPIYVSFIYKQK